jgi:hypothetical protein
MGKDSIDDVVRSLVDGVTNKILAVSKGEKFETFLASIERTLEAYRIERWPTRKGIRAERTEAIEYLNNLTSDLSTYPLGNQGIIASLRIDQYSQEDAHNLVNLAKQYIEFLAKVQELRIHGNGHRNHAQTMYDAFYERTIRPIDILIQHYNEPLIQDNPQRYAPFLVGIDDYRKIKSRYGLYNITTEDRPPQQQKRAVG